MNECLIVAKAKLLSRRLCTPPDPPRPLRNGYGISHFLINVKIWKFKTL